MQKPLFPLINLAILGDKQLVPLRVDHIVRAPPFPTDPSPSFLTSCLNHYFPSSEECETFPSSVSTKIGIREVPEKASISRKII